MEISDLPAVNASLNAVTTVLLIVGYGLIKRGERERHRMVMIAALTTSALFLLCYCIYHVQAGSVKYPLDDWTRLVYFAILIPHVILAAVMCPIIAIMVWHALRGNFSTHKRWARVGWPMWLFVSITGVVVYLMLYQWAGAGHV